MGQTQSEDGVDKFKILWVMAVKPSCPDDNIIELFLFDMYFN